MVSVLPAAYEALKLGAGGDNGFDDGMFDGRDVTHWSHHLLIAGSVIGLITLVAGFVFSQLIISIQGGILLATNAIGAYYINKFSVFHAAGEVIQALTQRIHDLWTQVNYLHKEERKVKKNADGLDQSVSTLQGINQDQKKILKEKQALIKELGQVHVKLKKVSTVCQKLKGGVDKFIGGVDKLSGAGHHFTKNIEELIKNARELAQLRSGLSREIEELTAERQHLVDQNDEIHEAVDKLKIIMKNWPQKYRDLKEQNRSLKEDVEALTVAVTVLKNSISDMERLEKDFEKIAEDLSSGVANRKDVEMILELLKKKKIR